MAASVSSSRTGMRMAFGVGRMLPRPMGRSLARFAGGRMAAGRNGTYSAARANQYVVSGMTLVGEELGRAARENVESMALALYDLYHTLNRPAERDMFARDGAADVFLERNRTQGPFMYVGVHLGNFDLVGRQLGFEGWNPQILSVPAPHGGYEWQNEYREQAGFEVTPISLESLKEATRKLEAGGSLLTGLDRPMSEPDKVQPRFFGQPSPLPLLHVRLAMRAEVPVVLLTAPRTPDGRYRLLASEPIPMQPGKATPELLAENAERCLRVAEAWIREYPQQWAMPHVVWPEVVVPEEV